MEHIIWEAFEDELEKMAGQTAATFGGAVPGIFAAGAPLGASDGKRLRTWGGALTGQILGGIVGSMLTGSRMGGILPGVMAGGALGANLAHGPNKRKRVRRRKRR